jgi:poly(A) polymerase
MDDLSDRTIETMHRKGLKIYIESRGETEQVWFTYVLRKIYDEALCSADPGAELEKLLHDGALKALPEVEILVRLGEDSHGLHKDVWAHTKAVVAGVPNQLELRWAALLHDIGKARTRRMLPGGKVTFHGHDIVGARQVDDIQGRLGLFEPALLTTVRSLVLHHLRPASYKHLWTESAVRRLITEVGDMDTFNRLMTLSRADLTTKVPARRQRAMARAAELEARVNEVLAVDNRPKLPKGTMGLVIERTQRVPGAWLREIQGELEARMAAGTLASDLSAEQYATIAIELAVEKSIDG